MGGWVPGDGQGIFGFQRWWPGMAGAGKKVVPPPIGRVGEDDEVGNADLPGVLRVWGWKRKSADFLGVIWVWFWRPEVS